MPDSRDIVTRLRGEIASRAWHRELETVLEEAADEIERLRASQHDADETAYYERLIATVIGAQEDLYAIAGELNKAVT